MGGAEGEGRGKGVLSDRELTRGTMGWSEEAGEDGIDGNRARRATAVVGEVEDEGDGSGDPGSIPPVGRERRMRRSALWSSIYSGRLQSTVSSSTDTAASWSSGGERERDEREQVGRIGRGAGGRPVRGFDHQGSMAPVMVRWGRRRRFELSRYSDELQGKTIDLRNPLLFYFLFFL